MQKIRFITMILSLCAALFFLDSCGKQGINELGNSILGAWFCEYDASGELNAGNETISYSHVAQYAEYNEDCTGLWCVAYFGSNRNTPIFMLGGHDIVDTRFTFQSSADGSITMSREAEVYGLPQSWTVFFAADKIRIADGGHSPHLMDRATQEQKSLIIKWEENLRGNDSGMMDIGDYNEQKE